jgi:NAD(P)-dependent dehydrogenase (short-subunit alcohol dehydrogenase family)
MDLRGTVAIVTGASAGIGPAYALALAGAGTTVVAAARRLGGGAGDASEANSLATVVREPPCKECPGS